MAGYKVGYFIGSLATKSINRLLAQALVRLVPPELQMSEITFKATRRASIQYCHATRSAVASRAPRRRSLHTNASNKDARSTTWNLPASIT